MALKEYMPIEKINKYILSKYPFEVYDVIPIKFKDTDKQRAVYKVESSGGPKCLKKVYFDESNLLFVYSIIQWFYINGIKVPKLLPTSSKDRYVNYNNSLFILTDWIDGRKCDYDIDEDICKVAYNLGRMHVSSCNFNPINGSFIRRDDTDWYKTFNRRYLQLLQFNNFAFRQKNEFNSKYLSTFEYFEKKACHALRILSGINNNELIYPAEKQNSICHLDYVNKNLIFTPSGELYVIDFDKSKIDIPIHDLGTFLKRILKRDKTSWDFNILTMTLENYEKARELTLIEFLGLFSFLEFPQKYWKISRDYFSSRNEYSKKILTTMISRVNGQVEDHSEFCRQFQAYIENRFNINLRS